MIEGQKYETKDSGKREEFATGSRRDTREGKGRYDLISPVAMRRLAGVLERGAAKYGDRNWEKGQPLARYLDSALRHIFNHLAGMRDEDHVGQAMWNLHAYVHTEEMIESGRLPKALCDVPPEHAPPQHALPIQADPHIIECVRRALDPRGDMVL